MWTWDQSAGQLLRDGVVISTGYAGAGRGRNNPALQDAVGMGPIPRGDWRMTLVKDSPNTGPFTIVLEPCEGTDTCGRSAFRVHGDSIKNPGMASHGCIIVPRMVREKLWGSQDHIITVIE